MNTQVTAGSFFDNQAAARIRLPRFDVYPANDTVVPNFADCQIVESVADGEWLVCVGRNRKGCYEVFSLAHTDVVVPR